jgi:hypothetical protein
MRFPYDKGGKWMIDHQGKSLLNMGGVRDVVACYARPGEVVQPRQLPDGLLEVVRAGDPTPRPYLIEIETYPSNDAPEQLLRDLLLVYLDRGVLPEALVFVLHPKGNLHVAPLAQRQSPQGLASLSAGWRVVELWTLPAEELLALDDPGVVPWIPLTHFEGPPEAVFQRCRDIIDRKAKPEEKEPLLVVSQVLASLRYNRADLLAFFGGKRIVIESPLIDEIVTEAVDKAVAKAVAKATISVTQGAVLTSLRSRFGPLPQEVTSAVRAVEDTARLDDLVAFAAVCPDLAAFRTRLGG